MLIRPPQSHPLISSIGLLCSAVLLTSCQGSKRPDKTFDVCAASAPAIENTVLLLEDVSDRFGYEIREYGPEAKADLEAIDANSRAIPDTLPVQVDVENDDGKVILIASNFGGEDGHLRVSFFFYREGGESSPFYQEVVSGLSSLSDVQIYPNDTEEDVSPCDGNG